MAFVAAGLTQLASALTSGGAGVNPYIQLHSADPGATGLNPTTHGRVQASFTNTNGVLSISAARSFTGGAASGAVTHVGLWSAASGGTFYGSFAISNGAGNDLTSNAAGAYQLNTFTITGA